MYYTVDFFDKNDKYICSENFTTFNNAMRRAVDLLLYNRNTYGVKILINLDGAQSGIVWEYYIGRR